MGNYLLIEMTKMNYSEESGSLNVQKGELIKKFASLTEDDQLFHEGEKQKIAGEKQIRLGKTKEELQKIVAKLYGVNDVTLS